MTFFSWSSRYSVGVTECDEQHKLLIEMLNDLYGIIKEEQGSEAIEQIIDRLTDYTKLHFSTEETLLARHNYPDLAAHKKEHEALAARVLMFKEQLKHGGVSTALELGQFLRDWLSEHLLGVDMKYGRFLNEHGVE